MLHKRAPSLSLAVIISLLIALWLVDTAEGRREDSSHLARLPSHSAKTNQQRISREANKQRGGRDDSSILLNYPAWQAERFAMHVEWAGGGTHCNASWECYNNNQTDNNTTYFYQAGFALSNGEDGEWKDGTKRFENKVHESDPDADFYYLVIAFNLTLYGRFECQFVNTSHGLLEVNDTNIFEILIQGERGFAPMRFNTSNHNCSLNEQCMNCAFAYYTTSKLYIGGWPNYNYNYTNNTASDPNNNVLVTRKGSKERITNSTNTISLRMRRGVIAISAIEINPIVIQVPKHNTTTTTTTSTTTTSATTSHTTTGTTSHSSSTTTGGTTTSHDTSTTSHVTTSTSGTTTSHSTGTTTSHSTGSTTTSHSTGSTTTTSQSSTSTTTGGGTGGDGGTEEFLGLKEKVWIGIAIAVGAFLVAMLCIIGWLFWWFCYHTRGSSVYMDASDGEDYYFSGRDTGRYHPISGFEIQTRGKTRRKGSGESDVASSMDGRPFGWGGNDSFEEKSGFYFEKNVAGGGGPAGGTGVSGGGRNRSMSKAKSYTKLPDIKEAQGSKDITGSFRKASFMDKRRMLWNFDPRERDASSTILGMRIGRGSKGDVFKGVSQVAGVVAIKVVKIPMSEMDEEYTSSLFQFFDHQSDKARKLHHPNLLQVFMVFTDPSDQLCMSMEYMALGRLHDVIKNHTLFLDFDKIKKILINTSHAMAYLHNQHPRIVHGELSSYSLLVNDNWECKVGGFGIHKLVKGARRATVAGNNETNTGNTTTSSGFLASSKEEKKALLAPWTAPELLSDNESSNSEGGGGGSDSYPSRLTEKADIYAFGVIMWECITRKDATKFDYEEIQNGTGADRLPEGFAQLILECCSPDPSLRPPFHQLIMDIASVQWSSSHSNEGEEEESENESDEEADDEDEEEKEKEREKGGRVSVGSYNGGATATTMKRKGKGKGKSISGRGGRKKASTPPTARSAPKSRGAWANLSGRAK